MRDNERFIVDLNKKRETAWQQLYEEFYPALCTYVAKLTHENVGVEDIVQECMIGLWDSSLQFPNVRSLAGWLYKAVYNRALNMIRDRDNARRLLGNYTSGIDQPGCGKYNGYSFDTILQIFPDSSMRRSFTAEVPRSIPI